jgi:hypothetical protein
MKRRRPGGRVIDQYDALNVWSRGGERAPHKPLLVLYALGYLSIVILYQWLPGSRPGLEQVVSPPIKVATAGPRSPPAGRAKAGRVAVIPSRLPRCQADSLVGTFSHKLPGRS